MVSRLSRATLMLILLMAAILRLSGLDWDNYNHYHPDERYILWLATTIEWPTEWSTAFQPHQSTFNPYYWPPEAASAGILVEQDQPRRFAYGHLPLYMGVTATRLAERLSPLMLRLLPEEWMVARDIFNGAERNEMRHITAVSRTLTALIDLATVLLLYFLGRQLYGRVAGLLAAAFLAFNVMHVQLARFFTVDPYQTFFTVAALLGLVLYVQARRANDSRPVSSSPPAFLYLMLAAAAIGLAVGSKFAAIMLGLPLFLAVWWAGRDSVTDRLKYLVAAMTVALLLFTLTNPFALIDRTCALQPAPGSRLPFHLLPGALRQSCYLQNIAMQSTMVRGAAENLAFTYQYAGTLPYLYPIEMQLRWGMGLLLGLLAFAGFIWAAALPLADWRSKSLGLPLMNRRAPLEHLVVLAWVIPFFLITAAFYVKFMRYLQPITPFLMLYAAAFLLAWAPARWWRPAAALAIAVAALYALAFVNMYRQPHPWITASQWVYERVPPGSLILGERWDDSLPLRLPGADPGQYERADLNWMVGSGRLDNEAKLAENLVLLEQADYVILATNRNYGVVPRLPERYPISGQYHQLLFDGRLGYEVVYVGGRYPNLAGFHHRHDTFGWPGLRPPAAVADYRDSLRGLNWGRVDESFVVYDQPLVIILANRDQLTAAQMAAQFDFR